jgi:hypothetical protein
MDSDSLTQATLDGKTIVEETTALAYSIALGDLPPGEHRVSVKANGVGTRYELSSTDLDLASEELMPVVVEKTFHVK